MEFAIADDAPAEAVLEEAARRYGDRAVLTTGFGLEGSVLLHMIARARLPIRIVTLDTGLLFEETYRAWTRLQDELGLVIEGIKPDLSLDEQAALVGPELWKVQPNECCAIRKVRPLERVLKEASAWITGIRRDQTPERASTKKASPDERYGVVKLSPLADWTISQVRAYLDAHRVPYNPLFDDGYPSIGCAPCTQRVEAGADPRSGRWAGFEKRECGIHFQTNPDGTVSLRRSAEAAR